MISLKEILTPNKANIKAVSPLVLFVSLIAFATPIITHLMGFFSWDFLYLTFVIPVFFASLYFGFRGGFLFIILLGLAMTGTELYEASLSHQHFLSAQLGIVLFTILGCCLGTGILSGQIALNHRQLVTTQEELLRSVNNLTALVRTSSVLNSSLSLEAVLGKANKLVEEALGITTGIFLLNQDQMLVLSSSMIYSEGQVNSISYNIGEGPVGRAAATQSLVYVSDIMEEADIAKAEKRLLGRQSAVCLPMMHDEELIGVATFWASPGRAYDKHQIALLHGLITQMGLAITNAKLYERVQHLSTTDELTGLYNHRFLQERLEGEITRAQRSHAPVSFMLLDIDYFKNYNDTFGHPAGDKLLRQLSAILKNSVRSIDVVARYGGEEFAIILVDTPEEGCLEVAERIRRDIEQFPFEGRQEQPGGRVTISIGIASFPRNAANRQDLIWLADQALYKVKQSTRNRVAVYSSVLDELKNRLDLSEQDLINKIESQLAVINSKDRYTFGHSERVVQYVEVIAKHLQMPEDEIKQLRYGAFLHDIGKLGIDRKVLNKKDLLNKEELNQIKSHASSSAQLLSTIPSLKFLVPMVLHHHERYDGTGYPAGLAGTDIPLRARILAVADTFDAITVNRSHKSARSWGDAVLEIRRNSGSQFDPQVVEAFLEALAVRDLKVVV